MDLERTREIQSEIGDRSGIVHGRRLRIVRIHGRIIQTAQATTIIAAWRAEPTR